MAFPSLANATIYLIRHAEKPTDPSDPNLSAQGSARASAYVDYFKTDPLSKAPLTPSAIFAAADSTESYRPRLTVTPLSEATGLPLNLDYKDKHYDKLAKALGEQDFGQHIVICWHHGEIPGLLQALGANAEDMTRFLPGYPAPAPGDGKWPSDCFDRVVVLLFDADGNMHHKESALVFEHLMPGDETAANA